MLTSSPLDYWVEALRPSFQSGVDLPALLIGCFILAVLLGYSTFTDLRGKIIPNLVTVPLILAAATISPLLNENAGQVLLIGLASSLFFIALSFTGGFGGGDAKLLAALSLLLGGAVWAIYFIALVIGIIYALPVALRARRDGHFQGRIGKIKLQFGPAIALALPVVILIWGTPSLALAFLGVGLGTLLLCQRCERRLLLPAVGGWVGSTDLHAPARIAGRISMIGLEPTHLSRRQVKKALKRVRRRLHQRL